MRAICILEMYIRKQSAIEALFAPSLFLLTDVKLFESKWVVSLEIKGSMASFGKIAQFA
jgi:hypothetical protein